MTGLNVCGASSSEQPAFMSVAIQERIFSLQQHTAWFGANARTDAHMHMPIHTPCTHARTQAPTHAYTHIYLLSLHMHACMHTHAFAHCSHA